MSPPPQFITMPSSLFWKVFLTPLFWYKWAAAVVGPLSPSSREGAGHPVAGPCLCGPQPPHAKQAAVSIQGTQ